MLFPLGCTSLRHNIRNPFMFDLRVCLYVITIALVVTVKAPSVIRNDFKEDTYMFYVNKKRIKSC